MPSGGCSGGSCGRPAAKSKSTTAAKKVKSDCTSSTGCKKPAAKATKPKPAKKPAKSNTECKPKSRNSCGGIGCCG